MLITIIIISVLILAVVILFTDKNSTEISKTEKATTESGNMEEQVSSNLDNISKTENVDTQSRGYGENKIATMLIIIGILEMVGGFFVGLVFGNQIAYGFSTTVFLAWTFGGFVSGMLFIGFAEVIKLLTKINYKMEQKNK